MKVGEWSDRASMISQESRKSTKSSKNTKETAARSRSASISEVENASIRDSNSSIRDSNLPRESRRTKSTGSRSRLNSGTSSDFEGSLSESEQRETIQFPDELKAKQREASERFSVASSAASSTMDKSTGRMQELFKTATENLHQSNKGISNAEEEVDDAADDTKRASGVTVSSNSSNMRRLDSVIGQLEFDEMMSR